MKSVISELWNGEIAPCEHCGAQDGLANILFSKMKQGRETMEKILPEERRDVLESYSQLWEDYLLRMMELSFQEGLVLGLRLGREVFSLEERGNLSCKILQNAIP